MTYPHPNVVLVKEMVVGSTLNNIYMVMEYVDHDLKSLMETMKQVHFVWLHTSCVIIFLYFKMIVLFLVV
jgi:hypothetical protein